MSLMLNKRIKALAFRRDERVDKTKENENDNAKEKPSRDSTQHVKHALKQHNEKNGFLRC